jgi:hypothetical protein
VRALWDVDLDVHADAGTVQLEDVRGRIRVRTAAGQVIGESIGGSLDVETHAGAVKLDLLFLDPGEHRVRADVGSVRIDMPATLDVDVEAHADMGGVKVEPPRRPLAPARLLVSADVGSVRVRSRPAPAREDAGLMAILRQVQAGTLSPGEAQAKLRALRG